jgi:hypothetical protein
MKLEKWAAISGIVSPLANGMMENTEVSSWWEANAVTRVMLDPGFIAAINQVAGRD